MRNDPLAGAARHQLPVVARQLGIDLPTPVADALEQHRTAVPFKVPPSPSTAQLVAAVRAATANGQDPATDPEVQRIVTAQQLARLGDNPRALGEIDVDALDAAIAAHAEAIIAALGVAIDRDGATLTEAHRQLGAIDLDEPGIANRLSDTQAAAWVRAREARNRIEEGRKLWRLMVHVGRLAAINPHRRICEIATPTLDQCRSLPNDADAWATVRAGMIISAAAPATEYEHRSEKLDAEQAAEQAEQQTAASRGLRFAR